MRKLVFARVSLLQWSLHVTLGKKRGLKISKVVTSRASSFESLALNTFQNLQTPNWKIPGLALQNSKL
jgi:hypothetical protein